MASDFPLRLRLRRRLIALARALAPLGAFACLALPNVAAAVEPTTTSLTVTPRYAAPGQPVTLTALVDVPGVIWVPGPWLNPFPGTATFYVTGEPGPIPGCAALPFPNDDFVPRDVSCTFVPPGTSEFEVHVEYSGGGNYAPSTSPYRFVTVASAAPVDTPLPLQPDGQAYNFAALVTSSPVALSGFTGTRPVSVVGGQYSIGCTGPWTTAPGTVSPGDVLCVRHVTPAASGEYTSTTLTIGTVSSTFETYTDYPYYGPNGQEATIAAGISHNVAYSSSNGLAAWGDNTGGKLGNGTTSATSIPDPVRNTNGPIVAAGLEHSLFLSYGTVTSAGLDTSKQLGTFAYQNCTVPGETGTFPCNPNPAQVPGLDRVVSVAAGWRHSLALRSDGTVWAWGSGYYGQNGKTADQSAPAQVAGIPGTVVRITAGYMHSVALLEDGRVFAWGSNQFGELGPAVAAGTGQFPTPVEVTGLTGVVDIAAGGSYTLALKGDGTVWSWGVNVYGQLGDPNQARNTALNAPAFRATPAAIPGLSSVRQVSAGFSFAFARRNDGTVLGWGLNHKGQVNGTAQSAPANCGTASMRSCILAPTSIPYGNVIAMYAGGAHAVLLGNTGSLRIIGDNSTGQRALPIPVPPVKFTQTTFDPDTFLNPAGVSGTPAGIGLASAGGSMNLDDVGSGVNFGDQPTGVRSTPITLRLTNLSDTAALTVGAVTVYEYDSIPGEFTVDSRCPSSLAKGASCEIDVSFTPEILYTRSAYLNISVTYGDSYLLELPLTGSGVDPRPIPTVTLASPGGPSSAEGAAATFVATVTAPAPVAGTVAFRRLVGASYPGEIIAGCDAVPVVAGAATCTTSAIPAGYYQIWAVYSGSDALQGAYSALYYFQVLAPPSSPLTVARTGAGAGTVTSSPAGINCGATCTASFATGSAVVLTATPATGSVFAGWSGGGCTGTGTCSVTVNAATTVTAAFDVQAPPTFGLTVTRAGNGTGAVTSSPSGIACGATCAANFASGTAVTLTPAPAAGSFFTGWSGACSGTVACAVTMSEARTVTATFTTQPTLIPRLGNLSTRMAVGTGDNVLIGGLVIGGTQPKRIVIRARGPSLTPLGVPGAMADPQIALYAGQTLLDANDNWQSSPDAAAIQATGFEPLHPNEAAVIRTLTPGGYTAIVSGAGGTGGVALVEAFEVDLPQVPLINIATRGFVSSGDNVMIGGFVILGTSPQTVIIRARGPSLGPLGVPNTLSDPVLRLYDGASNLLKENDDWQASPDAARIQSLGYAPADAKEAAILVTLPPGGYTAIVSGANGATGIAIVEVFAQ